MRSAEFANQGAASLTPLLLHKAITPPPLVPRCLTVEVDARGSEGAWFSVSACKGSPEADPGGPGGPPLAPKIFSKSCSFQAILREKPLF